MASIINEQYAYRVSPLPGQTHVINGEPVISFRGETWTFVRVSRPAVGNSSGRILVRRPCPDAYDRSPSQGGGRECVHMWHPGGVETGEYFPHVFDLYLGDESGREC